MNEGTFRDVSQLHRIADFDICGYTGDDLAADFQLLRSDDVALLTVYIVNQSDVCITVRIVFDRRNISDDAVLVALEVDDTILLLHTAALVACCDTACIAAFFLIV